VTEREVWLIIREREILDVHTSEEAAEFMAGDDDQVIPYTIRIEI
jgi:hypothetical protein